MSGRAATTDVIPGKYAIAVGIPQKPLPTGWTWVRLTDVASMATGHTPSRLHPEYWDGEIAWIGIKDARLFHGKRITSTLQTVTQLGIDNSASVVLPANTVCLSRTASVGYVTITDSPMATSQDFVNWKCSDALVPEFLMYLLIAERDSLLKFGKGTTHTTIYFPEAKALCVAIPPATEQRRIVAKIEELLSDLDAGVAALQRVRANLKRYRASVLNSAVTGNLTTAWRRHNLPTEDSETLLARILKERKRKWETDQLSNFTETSKTPPKKWRFNYVELVTPDTYNLPELPERWCWATVDQLCWVGTGTTPSRGVSRFYEGGTIPWVTSTAANEVVVTEGTEYVTTAALDETNLRLYPKHTLIIALYGEGQTRAKTSELLIDATLNQALAALVLSGSAACCRPYLKSFLLSNYDRLRRQSAGGVQPNLNLGLVRKINVPLPPADEQAKIVAEVERRLSVIGVVEAEIERGLKRAARLRQAILKRAFEGKLVPQIDGEAHQPAASTPPPLATSPRRRGKRISPPPRIQRKHRKGIAFYRGAVMSYAVNRLCASPHFGRTEAMKTMYLTEAWLGIDLELEPVREKMGPLDIAIYKVESLAKKLGWFNAKKSGPMIRYSIGQNIEDRLAAGKAILGDKLSEFDRLLGAIEKMDTDRAELFATTFAVWNDLLLDEQVADDAAIITGIHGWHSTKAGKFPADRIVRCINWMKQEHFVPRGMGPRSTILAG